MTSKTPVVYVRRKSHFSAAHRLWSKQLSDEKNKEIFSKCNNTHGHNYIVKVTVRGPVDPVTGMVIDVVELKKYMSSVIDDTLDHKNLDVDVPYFRETVSTMENITIFIFEQIKSMMPKPELLYEVKVCETDNNVAIYRGENV